jgi:hypothetical protein
MVSKLDELVSLSMEPLVQIIRVSFLDRGAQLFQARLGSRTHCALDILDCAMKHIDTTGPHALENPRAHDDTKEELL